MTTVLFRKALVFAVIVLFVGAGVVPSISGRHIQEDLESPRLHQCLNKGILQGNIELTYDLNDIPSTITPEQDTVRVHLYFNYYVSGLGSKFIVPKFFRNRTVPVKLSVENVPEWCSYSITPDYVYLPIGMEKSDHPQIALLTLSVNRSAPAFQTFSVNIRAKASSVKGPFGIIKIIKNAENMIPIEFKPGYYPDLDIDLNQTVYMHPGTGETTNVSIKLTNYGNARIRVSTEIIDPPEGWSIRIHTEIFLGTPVLNEDNTGELVLQLVPPWDFFNDVEQVNLSFKYMAWGHPDTGISESSFLITLMSMMITLKVHGMGLLNTHIDVSRRASIMPVNFILSMYVTGRIMRILQ
jgi:hypothetical protein